MLSVYLLLPLISLTVGSPFPDSSSEVDDLGSVSSNTQGWDAFGANALSAVNLPNVDSSQPFSTVSFSDDSLFADEPLSYSGFGSSNLPNALAIAGAGSNDNIFDTTTFDDGLPGGLLDEDGSEDFFELASNPATDGCLSEGNQPYGKRKRLLCPNSETESEAPSRNKDPMLGGGLDQPDVFQKDICMLGFEPVCCTGSDYLGLVQTGCSKCKSFWRWRRDFTYWFC